MVSSTKLIDKATASQTLATIVSSTTDSWKACSILRRGLRASSIFSETEKLMRQIGAVTCNVSCVTLGTDMRSHHGEANAFIRCHLPLVVPASLPVAGMAVGGEKKSWEKVSFTPSSIETCTGGQSFGAGPNRSDFRCHSPRAGILTLGVLRAVAHLLHIRGAE